MKAQSETNNLKVLLVNPPAETIFEMHDAPEYPHIGLGYVASYLMSKGIDTSVIDAKLLRIDIKELYRRLKSTKFDVIGLSAMTHEIKQAAKVAALAKEINKDCKVLLGGVHISALPKETLESFKDIDMGIVGEGELTAYEIVDALSKGNSLESIKGIVFRDGDEIKINPPRERIENLDSLPFPAWQMFPKSKVYHIMGARGCPFNCVFCMSPYGRKLRERSPENVIKEIEWVINTYGPETYVFNDETFACNRSRAMETLKMMIDKGFAKKTKFWGFLRADLLDYELLVNMKKAGFDYISIGLESGDENTLKVIRKGITLEQSWKAVQLIKKAGLKVGANFILGHPYDTKKSIKKTLKYATKVNGYLTAIGIMVPYPGTEVAEMVKKGEGNYKLKSLDWRDFNKQIGNALEMKDISRRQLEMYQMWGYIRIYLFNLRLISLIKFIWQYRLAGFALLKKWANIVKRKDNSSLV